MWWEKLMPLYYLCHTIKAKNKFKQRPAGQGLFFLLMFFCVDMIRAILMENTATSAIRGCSVKASFTDAVKYVVSLTGMTPDEIAQFLPCEYSFKGTVYLGQKAINFTATKSRFEIYPLIG